MTDTKFKAVPESSYYNGEKVIEWKELSTPFGRVRVLHLAYAPSPPAFGTITLPENPEQMVAEFVDGPYKGIHTGHGTKNNYTMNFHTALKLLFAEMAQQVASAIEDAQISTGDMYNWRKPL